MSWIKGFCINRKIKRNAALFDSTRFNGRLDTVGVLLDESQYSDSRNIEDELRGNGIGLKGLEFKVFRKKSYLEVEKSINFCPNNVAWNAGFKRKDLKAFVEKDFDLLISYYNQEDILLRYLKHVSKAKFKVGFSKLDDPINQLDINVELSDCSAFCKELKKYLLLLKK